MARGWESKDVEAQVADVETKKSPSHHGPKSPEQHLREQSINDLQMSRTRITNDLSSATNPHHRNAESIAAAVTITGMTSGAMMKPDSRARPGKRPRANPMAAAVPSPVARMLLGIMILMLVDSPRRALARRCCPPGPRC